MEISVTWWSRFSFAYRHTLAYTKARKTQHARIRYNNHISDYKEKHYEPWRIAAEKARDEFQKANDINGFQKWLDEHKDSFWCNIKRLPATADSLFYWHTIWHIFIQTGQIKTVNWLLGNISKFPKSLNF